MLKLLSLIPGGWIGQLIAVSGIVLTLLGGYRIWRHGVWAEGRDAAIAAVKVQDARAVKAANDVIRTSDECFAREGWWWNVITGKCEEEIVQPETSP